MDQSHAAILGKLLNAYSPMAVSVTDIISEAASTQIFGKGEIIFSEKRYNAFEYFQLQGVAHRYNIDEDRQELTTGIYQNEIVITPHFARTTNSQSIFSLQALTDCVYVKVPVGTFNELRESHPAIRAFGQRVVEREFIRNLHYEVLFRSFTAKDRLLFFRANYPQLENIIPHGVIASFLGITPVSFSRLRSDLARNAE